MASPKPPPKPSPELLAALNVLLPKKRGRPVTTGTTPVAERLAKSRANLLAAGGKRLTVNLSPEAAEHLGVLMLTKGWTEKETVERALAALARSIR